MKYVKPAGDDGQQSVREWLALNPQVMPEDSPSLDCGPDSQVAQ